jgi:beta-lactamase class D
MAALFRKDGVEGTLVLSSLRGGETMVHDERRARQRFSPASTFKVFNTLIALEEGVVAGPDTVFKWDGKQREIAEWNHDQTLNSAFRVSCVWCYQQLAARIDPEIYRRYLSSAGYGVLDEHFESTAFWLDGSLRISALEQVEFLKKVVGRTLPYRAASYDTLRKIMLVESGPGYQLYAKTGWATRNGPQTGWYAGYLETSADTWIFALNMVMRSPDELPLRSQLVREALQEKGLLPAP